MQENVILGLDLGTSSIGWALFKGDHDGVPGELVDLGVRHFEEVVEPKAGTLKNKKRRTKRGLRKSLRRRRQRLDVLYHALVQGGLATPSNRPFAESESDPWTPYRLRARALEEQLEPLEIGRALYHLARRRGFRSNRGAMFAAVASNPELAELLHRDEVATTAEDEADTETAGDAEKKKEKKVVLDAIANLRAELEGRTLAQYFVAELEAGRPVRGRHCHRDMYEDEFERIWESQARFRPELLTEELRLRVHRAIFHQRPLRPQQHLKGYCDLEPRRKRADRAQLVAQRYRLWQDIVNLRLREPHDEAFRPLRPDERRALADYLETRQEATWEAVRKLLGLPKGSTFNLIRAKDKLKGNATTAKLRHAAPDLWNRLDEAGRDRLVETILTSPDVGKLYQTLRKKYDLPVERAYALAKVQLDDGTASLSSRAMRRILRVVERKPDVANMHDAQVAAGYRPRQIARLDRVPRAPSRTELTNPRVRKALAQLRRVVNALVATYGKPTVVRIELARDLSLTEKEREGLEKAQKQLKVENDEADKWWADRGVSEPTRTDRFWYRLAKQCGWVCPYTNTPIPQERASTARFQIEHIVPYSRSNDDSFNNLTLCESHANQLKGDRTPYEAFGGTPEWEGMQRRAEQWRGFGSGRKRALFLRQETPPEDEMVARQLNETRYLSRKAQEYLAPVAGRVEVTKGGATAMLREHWGLFKALHGNNEKTRDDLRHHAVDAVAVAFTTRSVFMRVTAHRKRHADGSFAKIAPLSKDTVPPAPAWLHDALRARLATLVVSHETTRGIRDAFHEDTAYGLRDPEKRVFHYRKPLTGLSESAIADIVDPGLRRRAEEVLRERGGKPKDAFRDGIPMGKTIARRARLRKPMPKADLLAVPADAPERYYPLGNNHHVAIFVETEADRKGNHKREGVFVSMLDAARRVRRGKARTLYDPTPPRPGLRFVMWLAVNDTVMVEDQDPPFYRVESLWATTNQLVLRLNQAATNGDKAQRLNKTPNTLKAVKVEVDPIGRVREVPEGKG